MYKQYGDAVKHPIAHQATQALCYLVLGLFALLLSDIVGLHAVILSRLEHEAGIVLNRLEIISMHAIKNRPKCGHTLVPDNKT